MPVVAVSKAVALVELCCSRFLTSDQYKEVYLGIGRSKCCAAALAWRTLCKSWLWVSAPVIRHRCWGAEQELEREARAPPWLRAESVLVPPWQELSRKTSPLSRREARFWGAGGEDV